MTKEKICGIYKITNPSGKIYIGQSENIYRRWGLYKSNKLSDNTPYRSSYPRHLSNSIKKYGAEKHYFEIVEICSCEELNNREMYWIKFYDTYNTSHGMNCTKGGDGVKGYVWSEEAKRKSSISHKGIKTWNTGISPDAEYRQKNSNGNKAAWARRKATPEYYSEEQKNRRKAVPTEVRRKIQNEWWEKYMSSDEYNSPEAVEKRRQAAFRREKTKREKGHKVSDETKERNREASLKMWEKKRLEGTDKFTGKALENMINATGRIVLNTQTGIFYSTVKEAAASIGWKAPSLSAQLRGVNKNKTNLIYV